MCVFAALAPAKLVVVVDDDVDIFDDEQVGWAVATRFQADRDITVLPGCRSGGLDPSAGPGGVTAKLIMDATAPADRREQHARMRSAVEPDRLAALVEATEREHAQ
jgi:2,5-furandicarboxylate decarboxylase 1